MFNRKNKDFLKLWAYVNNQYDPAYHLIFHLKSFKVS